MSESLEMTRGAFTFVNFAANFYKILVNPNLNYRFDCTATVETTKQLQIPFAHRLLRIHLTHLDTSDALATDNLDVSLRRLQNTIVPPLAADYPIQEETLNDETIVILLGEGYEFEPCVYTLGITTEENSRVIPIIYVQKIGKGLK